MPVIHILCIYCLRIVWTTKWKGRTIHNVWSCNLYSIPSTYFYSRYCNRCIDVCSWLWWSNSLDSHIVCIPCSFTVDIYSISCTSDSGSIHRFRKSEPNTAG
ncbi:unnamed protein product [Schistosoma curassoni]|uniref:Secreted protein n=1 Tax=Schistosoma curassoni TaxID=6186 RepID=A0A183JU02_9TREM|nr:unnamed protein product [Schistosoma curassoni]